MTFVNSVVYLMVSPITHNNPIEKGELKQEENKDKSSLPSIAYITSQISSSQNPPNIPVPNEEKKEVIFRPQFQQFLTFSNTDSVLFRIFPTYQTLWKD